MPARLAQRLLAGPQLITERLTLLMFAMAQQWLSCRLPAAHGCPVQRCGVPVWMLAAVPRLGQKDPRYVNVQLAGRHDTAPWLSSG